MRASCSVRKSLRNCSTLSRSRCRSSAIFVPTGSQFSQVPREGVVLAHALGELALQGRDLRFALERFARQVLVGGRQLRDARIEFRTLPLSVLFQPARQHVQQRGG